MADLQTFLTLDAAPTVRTYLDIEVADVLRHYLDVLVMTPDGAVTVAGSGVPTTAGLVSALMTQTVLVPNLGWSQPIEILNFFRGPAGPAGAGAASRGSVTLTYDGVGNLARKDFADGSATQFFYTAGGDLDHKTDTAGGKTTRTDYVYDGDRVSAVNVTVIA